MKMIFQIKHVKQRKNLFAGNTFKTLVILFLILVFILVSNIFSPLRSLLSDMFSPFFRSGNFFYNTLGQIPAFFSDKNKLMEENGKLRDELNKNLLDSISLESIKYENQKLREELQIKPAGNLITTSIVARSPQIPPNSLFLDKGTKDGINNGDLVLSGDRILIGKIIKISNNKATVALNSFAGMASYGYIARTNEPLEITGDGGGGMKAKTPIDFDIVVGDKIMVGNSLNYLTAIVSAIEEDRSSGFKNILMSLPVDVSKVGIVFVSHITSE
jgi:cell shape-determining protein MreC